MSKILIAILLVLGTSLSENSKTVTSDIIQHLMPNDTTGGEGGHIPPFFPFN